MRISLGHTLLLVTAIAAAASTPARAQSAEAKGLAIMQDQEDRDAGWDSVRATGAMVLYDAAGRRSARAFEIERGERNTATEGDLSKFLFKSPADIRDTTLLTHAKVEPADDHQWLYMPAVKRVKRISGANRTGKFVSSEFSYEDMGGFEVEDNDYRWLRDEPCPGASHLTCHVVASFPRSRASGYSKRVTWIDTAELRPYQTEFFNRNGAHEKTLTYSGYREYRGRHWRPHAMVMRNHQTGKRTDLDWDRYNFGVTLGGNAFKPQALGR